MPTRYRLISEGSSVDLDFECFRASLPASIQLELDADGLYASVDSAEPEDPCTQVLIDRELDRIFFVTCVRVRAEMCRRSVSASLIGRYRIHGRIPQGTAPLKWTDRLSLQLKLWSIAIDSNDYYLKLILFFQIIELSHPDMGDKNSYPPYKDSAQPPHPRTESKLLRHLVTHAGDAKPETGKYLEFLGLPLQLSNITHPEWAQTVSGRVSLVEAQAREELRSAL